MAKIANDIKKGVSWISSTFTGGDAARCQRDIPGWLAKWMFRIGTIWAVLLIPITALICLLTVTFLAGYLVYGKPFGMSKEMLICPYLLAGYAVWIGWGWRSRKPRNVKLWVLFWLASAGFNVMQPVHMWLDSHSFWDLFYPPPLWGMLTTAASLTALLFEFFLPRYENHEPH